MPPWSEFDLQTLIFTLGSSVYTYYFPLSTIYKVSKAAAAPQQDHSTYILLCIGIVGKISNIFKPKNTSLSPSCLQKLFHLNTLLCCC